MPHDAPLFTEATVEDTTTIARFAGRAFVDAFGHLYTATNREDHLIEKFSAEFFNRALENGNSILKLEDGERLIGYAMVGHVTLPVKPAPVKGAQEIHRVYIDKEYQGRGLGKALMLHILSLPRITTASSVYLGVWEENVRAQALYRQYGFEPVGRYLYRVGSQSDKEIIMARTR